MTLPTPVAILGFGTMGRAIAARLLQAELVGLEDLRCTARHEAPLGSDPLPSLHVGGDNVAAARGARVILLCTKPKTVAGVVSELDAAGVFADRPLVVSIAAGVSTTSIEGASRTPIRVVRAMPNTPARIGKGMTVLSPGRLAGPEDLATVRRLCEVLGRVVVLDEEHMDAATGLSGSGPAFLYVVIEALSEGGVMVGLPRAIATEMAAQTMLGAASMVLETGKHPAALKDEVTTPAGCTISALMAMEDGRLRSVLARGVEEAARTAAGLGKTKD